MVLIDCVCFYVIVNREYDNSIFKLKLEDRDNKFDLMWIVYFL